MGLLYWSCKAICTYDLGSNYRYVFWRHTNKTQAQYKKMQGRLSGWKATRKKKSESVTSIAVIFAASWALNILIFHSCSLRFITFFASTNNLSLCFNVDGAWKKTKQNKTKENKAKQSKTKQNKAKQNKQRNKHERSRKTLEQKSIFISALLILTVSRNALDSANLVCCFSRYPTFLIFWLRDNAH